MEQRLKPVENPAMSPDKDTVTVRKRRVGQRMNRARADLHGWTARAMAT